VRGLLDKLHVTPSFEKRWAYKSAANMFTETGFTKEHQESLESLVNDLQATWVDMVAERRKVDKDKVMSWLKGGPYAADTAKSEGLVDEVAYWDAIDDEARRLSDLAPDDDQKSFLDLEDYIGHVPDKGPSAGKVALIVGQGVIMRGGGGDGGVGGERSMGSDDITQAFRDARRDKMAGILFRVDSPGGSYVASDLVRREVEITRQQGIPVVISMGSLAASGGYFVSMQADSIVASPATLTGSIGVYGGSFATRRFFNDYLGVTFGTYDALPESVNVSGLDGPDAIELEKRKQTLDRIYADFVTKAAAGRKKTYDEMHAIAQGRVWSGKQAKERGLVDELGGFHVALKKLKELCKLQPDAVIELHEYPEPESLFGSLGHLLSARAALPPGLERASRLIEELERSPGTALLALPYRIDVR
jgi:protease-4